MKSTNVFNILVDVPNVLKSIHLAAFLASVKDTDGRIYAMAQFYRATL